MMREKKTALLVIDVQVAMFASKKALYRGDEVLGNIKAILKAARDAGMPVIFVQHTADGDFEKGAPTWAICPQVAPVAGELVIEKTHCDAFLGTHLHEALQERGIERLMIVGMQTDFCVDTSCRRAFSMGYELVLVSDGHSTYDTKHLTGEQIVAHHNRVLGYNFAKLKTAAQVLAELCRPN